MLGYIEATCQHCNKIFTVHSSRATHGRGKSCSRDCQYAAIKNRTLEKNKRTCIGCGSDFATPPSLVAMGRGLYCTRPCRDKHRHGALHPQYKGRPVHHRGPNWPAQKRKAKARDNHTCQHCGAVGTDAHHIIPYRFFTDYIEANRIENLIILCRPCHRKADALIQRTA